MATPRLIASFGIGGSGEDPAARYVNRVEFNAGGGGWPQFVAGRVRRAIDLGAADIALHRPFGDTGDPFQLDTYITARARGFKLLTEHFADSWSPIAAGREVICYIGGLVNDANFEGNSPAAFLSRLADSLRPVWDAGMSLALDGDGKAQTGTRAGAAIGMLKELDPTRRLYLEAWPDDTCPWGLADGVVIREDTYQAWKAQGFAGRAPEKSVRGENKEVIRIIVQGDINSVSWWQGPGREQVKRIMGEGDSVMVNADAWVDGGLSFAAAPAVA